MDKNQTDFTIEFSEISEEELQKLDPKIVEAIRAIQAERLGTEEIEWQDFSSHNKSDTF